MAALPIYHHLHHFKPSNSLKIPPSHLTKEPQSLNLYKSHLTNVSYLSRNGQIQQALNLISQMDNNGMQIGPELYVELLQGCLNEQALLLGQQIHGLIIKRGDVLSGRSEYIVTKLIIFYAKCDSLKSANLLFRNLSEKNVFSWAAMIGMNSRLGFNELSLVGFSEMLENGTFPDNFVVPNALKACGASQSVGFGKEIHGYVCKMGFRDCVYVASSLVDMYSKCGLLDDAQKVFDKMTDRNSVVWNSLIVGFVQNGMNEEALRMFYEMRINEGVEPTRVTVSSLLSASANLGAVKEGRQGHALLVLYGLELDSILGSSLINFYSKIGLIEDVELVFSRMIEKDVVTWNLLVSCYAQHGLAEDVVNTCRKMSLEGLTFDCVTMTSLFSSCADSSDLELGKAGHCYCIRSGLDSDVGVVASMVDMYAKCEEMDYAKRVFVSISEKDLVLYNTLLAAYAERGLSGEATKLFYEMQIQGFHPNVISWNSMLLGFLRNGLVDEAKELFVQMRVFDIEPNVVTWTTLTTGLAQNGLTLEAMSFFRQMQEVGIKPTTMSLTNLLSICISLTCLILGKAIHGYVTRRYHSLSSEIATGLVDMYAKCGSIDKATKVFNMVLEKKLVLYNAMISAFGIHSQAQEALALYNYITQQGIEPDDVTFTSVLSSCSHGGLVDEGLGVFSDIFTLYHRKPSIEHYGCLVSLLSKCGNLEEAMRVVLSMPSEPDAQVLGSLLSVCREENQVGLGEYISKSLLELEPDNCANYIALSNVYSAGGKWDKASKLRDVMKKQGLKKNPGCSWVQIGDECHVFVAGDVSHPQKSEISMILGLLEKDMRVNHIHQGLSVEILCS